MKSATLEPSVEISQCYFDIPALSNSGIKDLSVSPLRYWHKHINPERAEEPNTQAKLFGSALHCAVLEPDEFESRYVVEACPEDYPHCLVTCDDIRAFLRDLGVTPKGARKDDLIRQAKSVDPGVVIFDEVRDLTESGKIVINREDGIRLTGAVEALRREPHISQILSSGRAEVELFAKDPDTGAPLKSKLDWLSINGQRATILDLKTFSNSRGKSTDQAIADAIFYEAYYRQAYFYTMMLSLQPDAPLHIEFIFAFIESEEPFETRLKAMRPKSGGQPNLYWLRGLTETREACRNYADHQKRYGDRPWRSAQHAKPLMDEDIRQLTY